MTEANSLKAARRNAAGVRSEAMLARTHDAYHTLGKLRAIKCFPPTFGKPGALQFTNSLHIDYVGAIAPHGRMLAVESKGCTGASSFGPPPAPAIATVQKLAQYQRDVRRFGKQVQLLRDFQSFGAAAAILALDMKRERCWLITDFTALLAGEHVRFRDRDTDLVPSVAFSTLEQIAHGAPSIDYLPALLEAA